MPGRRHVTDGLAVLNVFQLAVKTRIALAILAVLGAVVAVRERNRPAVECLLAVLAGLAVVRLWKRTWMIAALCLWMVVASVAAHPDYLADFNLLAMGKPERIVADSDLDWGQDLHRATLMLQARGIREAWIAYEGTNEPACWW